MSSGQQDRNEVRGHNAVVVGEAHDSSFQFNSTVALGGTVVALLTFIALGTMLGGTGAVVEIVGSSGASRAAEQAYRASIDAYNRGDRQAYVASYEFPMRCYYNLSDYTQSDFESGSRMDRFERPDSVQYSPVVEVVDVQTDRVVLTDTGRIGTGHNHTKLIVMHRTNDGWRIVTEMGRSAHECDERLYERHY